MYERTIHQCLLEQRRDISSQPGWRWAYELLKLGGMEEASLSVCATSFTSC